MEHGITIEIRALRRMTVGELRDKYREVFIEETRSYNSQSVIPREVHRDHAVIGGGRSQIDFLPLRSFLIVRLHGIVVAAGRESKNPQGQEQENFPKCVGIHVRPRVVGLVTLVTSFILLAAVKKSSG